MSLSEVQFQHDEWRKRNFPDQTLEQALMGMMEEMGELCHAILKNQQQIRGMSDPEMLAKVMDAHCDLIIFSLFVANHFAYDLEVAIEETWADVVSKRDWVKDPERGGE